MDLTEVSLANTSKIAFLFLISYDHILHKEDIWKRWFESLGMSNVNIYVHVDDPRKVSSPWLRNFLLPSFVLQPTSYYHVCPALFALLKFAMQHDASNTWFVFLTDTCAPIRPASQFWDTFQQYSEFSVLRHSPPWWNVDFHPRANLRFLPRSLRFGHDAWFILTRADAHSICNTLFLAYSLPTSQTLTKEEEEKKENLTHADPDPDTPPTTTDGMTKERKRILLKIIQTVMQGGLANESIFACLLQLGNERRHIISKSTHYANFDLSTSPTSPFTFKNDPHHIQHFHSNLLHIHQLQKDNPFLFFFRKIHSSFPSSVILPLL